MTETIGQFQRPVDGAREGLELTFSPSSAPLRDRWRNNGLSADFLAGYVANFFPGDESDPASQTRRQEIHGAIGYIANELLENAMKFSVAEASHPTIIRLVLTGDAVLFTEINCTSAEHGNAFRAFVRELTDSDPAEIYVRQMERAASSGGSGLGLLTMVNDYGADLAWQFDKLGDGSMRVTTQVRLAI